MPRQGPANAFVPIKLPDHVVATMPGPVAQAWGDYATAVADWSTAKAVAGKAKVAASNAPAVDAAAAQAAVENNKPVPPATAAKATATADAARREVEPRVKIALRAEQTYVAVATEHRASWRDLARQRALAAAAEAKAMIDAADQAVIEATEAHHLWHWLSFGERLDRGPRGESSPSLAAVRAHIETELDPDRTERVREAELAEADERARLWKLRGL